MLRHLSRSLAWACTIAVGWGILEALYYYFAGSSQLGGLRMVTTAISRYSMIALCWSLPFGFVFGLVHRLRGKPEPGEGFYGAVYLALAVTLGAAFWINVQFLGGFLDTSSLLVDAGLLAVVWPLLTALLRRPFRALAAAAGPLWRRLGPVYWLAVLALWGLPLLGDDPRVGAPPPTASAPEGAPNVLFLLVDTLRADHLGCYGYERDTSPVLDRLAARGVLFEDCIAQAPHTKQSTASILTSLYPPTHKVEAFTTSLSPQAQTLPQLFHEGGWRTSLMSANSFLSPTYGYGRGVERFEGSLVNPAFQLVGSAVLNRFRRLAVQELHLWRPPWDFVRDLGAWAFLGGDNPYQNGMPGADIRDEFLGWHESLEDDRPWFAYLQFMEPHAPYDPAPEHRLFGNPEAGSELGVWFPGHTEITFLPFKTGVPVEEAERQAMLSNYDGCIHEVDAIIGEIFDELERRGELENTIVVLTSDHGEEFYDHGGWGHGHSLHAELLRVPLILAGPQVPEGLRVPSRVRSVDIMPSLLTLTGQEVPGECSGGLLPLVENAPSLPAYSEVQWGGHWAASWRDQEGSLIYGYFKGEESRQLFGVADRAEGLDLAGQDPATVQALDSRLFEMREEYAARAHQTFKIDVDEGTQGLMEGLGYVDGDDDEEDE